MAFEEQKSVDIRRKLIFCQDIGKKRHNRMRTSAFLNLKVFPDRIRPLILDSTSWPSSDVVS